MYVWKLQMYSQTPDFGERYPKNFLSFRLFNCFSALLRCSLSLPQSVNSFENHFLFISDFWKWPRNAAPIGCTSLSDDSPTLEGDPSKYCTDSAILATSLRRWHIGQLPVKVWDWSKLIYYLFRALENGRWEAFPLVSAKLIQPTLDDNNVETKLVQDLKLRAQIGWISKYKTCKFEVHPHPANIHFLRLKTTNIWRNTSNRSFSRLWTAITSKPKLSKVWNVVHR